MNGLPYYKAYPRDFIEGTIGMSFEIKAAYRLILDLIYMQGGRLPDDARYIAGLLGCSVRAWGKYRDALIDAGKISSSDGFISNFRADKEIETLAKLQDKQRENRSRPNKNKGLQSPRFDHTESEPEPEYNSDNSETVIDVGDGADAPPPSKYEFEANHIRLTAKDFRKWQEAYPHLSLKARLMALDEWAGSKGKDWFHAVSARLGKEEQAALERQKARYEQPAAAERSRDGRPGLAGYPFYVDARI